MNGGERIAQVLRNQGVESLFTLCGGHISPILVGAKKLGIRIVDVRDEASAVFAADAVARMTGVPGVAAVTAGPGVTNTLTAVQNAYMAQSPVVILGGATATALKGRGALQDIDQLALIRPMVKRAVTITAVRQLVPEMERAFETALSGVPGPVFVEVPVDLLYDESTIREWFEEFTGGGKGRNPLSMAFELWGAQHFFRQFAFADLKKPGGPVRPAPREPKLADVEKVAGWLGKAKRPVLVLGSQTVVQAEEAEAVADAVRALGVPTYCAGMCRGLLGRTSDVQFRHKRGAALKKADLVIVSGFPFDFRLGYGLGINFRAKVVTVNRNKGDLWRNRPPSLGVHSDAGRFHPGPGPRGPGYRERSLVGLVRRAPGTGGGPEPGDRRAGDGDHRAREPDRPLSGDRGGDGRRRRHGGRRG